MDYNSTKFEKEIQKKNRLSSIIVPTFEENRTFMLGVVFYSFNFHRSKYNFEQKYFIPH